MTDNKKFCMKNKSLSFLLFTLCCFACTDKNSLQQVQLSGNLGLSEQSVEIAPDGGNPVIISYCSDSKWSISSSIPNWLSVSAVSGKEGLYEIHLSANPGSASEYENGFRMATLSFKTASGKEDVLEVVQQRPYMHIVRKDDGQQDDGTADRTFKWNEYDGAGQPFELEIVSNVHWQYVLDSENRYKVTTDISRDENDFYKTVTRLKVIPAYHNFDKVPMSSRLEFFAIYADGTILGDELVDNVGKEWELGQKNLRFLINGKYDPISLQMGELTAEYAKYDTQGEESPIHELKIDTELSLSDISVVNNSQDWISASVDKTDSLVQIKVTDVNRSNDDRPGSISINLKADGEIVSREVALIQKPYILKLSSDRSSPRFRNEGSDTCQVSILTKGPWTCTYPEWTTVLNMEGKAVDKEFKGIGDNTFLLIVPKQNLDFSESPAGKFNFLEKTGKVELAGLKSYSVSEDYYQDKFLFSFENDPSSDFKNIPALGSEADLPVKVSCSGDWEISNLKDYDSWLTSTADKGGPETTEFSLKVPSSNALEKDRTAKLHVISKNHEKAGKKVYFDIEVRQFKYAWEISTKSLNLAAYDPRYSDPSVKLTDGSIVLKCSGKWQIFCPDWLKPSKSSGEKSDQGEEIFFIPDVNSGTASRRSEVVIKDISRNNTKELTVTQDKFVFELAVGQKKVFDNLSEINANDCKISFKISQNTPYSFSNSSWVTFEKAGESTADRVTTYEYKARISDNLERSERKETVTLENTIVSGIGPIKLEFSQKAFKFDSTPVTLTGFKPLSLTYKESKECSISCSGGWVVDNNNNPWITVSQSEGSGNATIRITPEDNLSAEKREGEILIKSTLANFSKSVKVSQSGYVFSWTALSNYSFAAEGNNIVAFSVKCTGGWSVKSKPDWMKLNPNSVASSSSETRTDVKMDIEDNFTLAKRSGKVILVSNEASGMELSFDCEQEAYVFDAAPDAFTFSATDTGSKTLAISCSQDWEIECPENWVTLSPSSGKGNATVKVSVSKNETGNDRTQTLVVKCKKSSELKKNITITQTK